MQATTVVTVIAAIILNSRNVEKCRSSTNDL